MEKKDEMGCFTAFFGTFLGSMGIIFIIGGIALISEVGKGGLDGVFSYFGIPLGPLFLYVAYKIYKKDKTQREKEKIQREDFKVKESAKKKEALKQNNLKKEKKIKNKLKKADNLAKKLSEIQEIKIIDISDYKKIIIDNEKNILEKGGDDQLFSFMKINTFLNDYSGRIISDQSGLKEVLDINWLKSRIESEEKRNDLDKTLENLEDSLARIEGRKTTGFDSNVNNLFELGDLMRPTLENQIKTMDFYRNMAVVMIVFYLDDKKIRYFELYEAFEKLGVFDSTWQKNVLNKLDNIEIRLTQMSNQLTELNQNFISLSESSENIVLELKEINSSVMTNNMLQAITAYQTWRINKNTKSLRP